MITIWLGSIPLGSSALTGPVGQSIERQNTFAEYAVTRGKPVLHEIGEELDTQTFDFFFSEEFCDPETEKAKLDAAFAIKTPLPLISASGIRLRKRYVVDSLSTGVSQTDRSGRLVRFDATIGLKESPVTSLLGLISSIVRDRAPAIAGRAGTNPTLKR